MLNEDRHRGSVAAQMLDEEDDSDSRRSAREHAARMISGRAAQPQFLRLHRDAQVQDAGGLRRARAEDGKPPFHLYTMRQAIEEKFILDVLQNYTTYKSLFRPRQGDRRRSRGAATEGARRRWPAS